MHNLVTLSQQEYICDGIVMYRYRNGVKVTPETQEVARLSLIQCCSKCIQLVPYTIVKSDYKMLPKYMQTLYDIKGWLKEKDYIRACAELYDLFVEMEHVNGQQTYHQTFILAVIDTIKENIDADIELRPRNINY